MNLNTTNDVINLATSIIRGERTSDEALIAMEIVGDWLIDREEKEALYELLDAVLDAEIA